MKFILIVRALHLKNKTEGESAFCPGCSKELQTGMVIYVCEGYARDSKCHTEFKASRSGENLHTDVISQPQQTQVLQYQGTFLGGFYKEQPAHNID